MNPLVMLDRRQLIATALLAPLAGCVTPIASRPAPSPFTAAAVVKGEDGYRITWAAQGAGPVRIFASATPSPTTRGPLAGQGGQSGEVTIADPAPGSRTYFTLAPDHGAPLVVADRSLHLPGIANLRDVGGYRTDDGRWVKMGLLYRSDQLNRASGEDLAGLERLGLRLVVDLRTASEREREPDRLPRGARPLILDVAADSEGSLGGDMRKASQAIAAGKGAELLIAANRDFVTLNSAQRSYTALLGTLAPPGDVPMLYHCTAGKDRTGWATAVILTLLGVPRATVMADYLASNDYLRRKNEATISALSRSDSPFDPALMMPVLTVRPAFLEAAFDEVDRRYGSFDAYLRLALGVTATDIQALRDRYLS